jgi:hypothetical protein
MKPNRGVGPAVGAANAGTIASKNGSAKAVPAPRSSDRRDIARLVTNMLYILVFLAAGGERRRDGWFDGSLICLSVHEELQYQEVRGLEQCRWDVGDIFICDLYPTANQRTQLIHRHAQLGRGLGLRVVRLFSQHIREGEEVLPRQV